MFGKKRPIKEVVEAFFGAMASLKASKTTDDENTSAFGRKNWNSLELAYYTEPVEHAGVNHYQTFCEYTSYKAWDSKHNTRVDALIEQFRTMTESEEVFFHKVPLHLGIYGNAFVELLYETSKPNVIGDYKILDAKTLIPVLKANGQPIVDARGNIRFFTQSGNEHTEQKDELLEVGKDILWLTRKQLTASQLGVGFIEPVYPDIKLKENMEQARAQQAYRRGFPLPVIRYGNADNRPNEKMFKEAKQTASDIANPQTQFAVVPYMFDLGSWGEGVGDLNINDDLMYITKLQAAVFQLPLAFLLMTGEVEHQSTLEPLLQIFDPIFKGFQKRLKVHSTLAQYVRSQGADPSNIVFQYGKLTDREVKEQVMRYFRLSKTGLLDVEDPKVKNNVKTLLGITKTPGERP